MQVFKGFFWMRVSGLPPAQSAGLRAQGSGQKKGMRYAVSGVRKRGLWRAQSAELLFSILHFLDI